MSLAKTAVHSDKRVWRLTILASRLLLFLSSQSINAQMVGDMAEDWASRTGAEKIVYQRGFCDGLAALSDVDQAMIGKYSCDGGELKLEKSQNLRFCLYAGSQKGVDYFDRFYRDPQHSEIPTWAVVVSFNDKACKEDRVTSHLPNIQARGVCVKKLINLNQARVSSEVYKVQKAECDRLP